MSTEVGPAGGGEVWVRQPPALASPPRKSVIFSAKRSGPWRGSSIATMTNLLPRRIRTIYGRPGGRPQELAELKSTATRTGSLPSRRLWR